jgi:hypothetical protein
MKDWYPQVGGEPGGSSGSSPALATPRESQFIVQVERDEFSAEHFVGGYLVRPKQIYALDYPFGMAFEEKSILSIFWID